jgi:outer membrane protein assembly factor BamD (BamD/ComL family)
MTDSEGSLRRAEAAHGDPDAAPAKDNGPAAERPPRSRPRSFTTPPPDPAEALYYEGMAAYQHRNWEEALARFSRLKELQPTRPGLDALLDEVRWFLQLQATAPHATSGSAENGLGGAYSGTVRQAGRWPTWLILIPVAVGLIALLLIAFQGRLPWSTAERGTQELYNRGQARLAVGDYEGAYAAFKKLLEVAPDDPEAQLGLVRAERQQTLAQGYAAAEAAIAEEDWDKAASELEKVLAVDANYAGAQAKADFISQRRRLAGLYSDGGRLYDLGRWEEAIAQFQKIRDLDASYRAEAVNEFLFTSYLNAGQALIASAAGGVASVQRAVDYFANALAIKPRNRQATDARRLGGLYLDAVRALANGAAGEAQARFETLLAEDPTYAGGQAARQLYALLLKQASAAVQAGDISVALSFYRAAQSVPVADHTAALDGAAYARSITPTPTPQPTSTPAPTSPPVTATPFAIVRSGAVNLRAGPGLTYAIVGQAQLAEQLSLTGRNEDGSWLRVCTAASDAGTCPAAQLVWITASQVEVQGAGDALPPVTPPPPPVAAPQPSPTPANLVACVTGQVRDTRGGAPLPGWTITLQGPGGAWLTQRTGSDGSYRFSDLAQGVYTVVETLDSNWRAVSPQTATITVSQSPDCIVVDFWNERTESAAPKPPR